MAEKPWHKMVAGNYLGRPYDVMDREAYRTASLRAKAVLDAIHRSFNGFNNGRIGVSRDQIAARIGSKNHKANREAIGELVARGLLAIEKTYPRGSRMATEFRLTYASTGDSKREVSATRDYVSWTPGDAGSGNKRRFTTEHEGALSGSTAEHDGKLSGSTAEPLNGVDGPLSCSTTVQHIGYQGEPASLGASQARETDGRHSCGGIERPRAIPEDRWITAGRDAANNPAGPDPQDLRQRVADYIEQHGRGAQTRLAQQAGIVGGTFSKFLKGDVDMTNRHRVALACTMSKAAAAEDKLKPRKAMDGGGK